VTKNGFASFAEVIKENWLNKRGQIYRKKDSNLTSNMGVMRSFEWSPTVAEVQVQVLDCQ